MFGLISCSIWSQLAQPIGASAKSFGKNRAAFALLVRRMAFLS
jgi:hypothetical protein